MIRVAITSMWVCLVVAATAFGWVHYGSTLRTGGSTASKPTGAKSKELIQTRQISMPVFKDGEIGGYFVLRFSVVAVSGGDSKSGVKIDDVAVDEALRRLPSLTPAEIQSGTQPAALAKAVTDAVNSRLGAHVVDDILFKEFTYVTAKDARR